MNQEREKKSDRELYASLAGPKKVRDEAFQEIYARYSGQIYLYCRKILSEPQAVEDVFQETFLRLLKTADESREMINLPAFILRIARNLCLEQKRFESKRFVDLEHVDLRVYETQVESRELETLLNLALDTLPPEHREAFVLQTYNGLSYNEIAEVTDVPVTTVRNRVVRAKHRIREILSRYFLKDPI